MEKKALRLKSIVALLQVKEAVSIKALVEQFGVSEMTVRRDLMTLAQENSIRMIPGGAILKFNQRPEKDEERYSIIREETKRTAEKMRIAQKALALIEPNDIITLDAGSTTEYLAKLLPEDLPVTVLCYALNILTEICRKKSCHPIFAGGYFHKNSLIFESPPGIELMRMTRTNKAFVTASGVSEQLGITCANPYELDIKRAAMHSAKTKILVTDSTKWGQVNIVYFADLQDFNMVITDAGLSEEYQGIIRNLGIELHLV